MITVQIFGPGLLVNTPAAIIYKAMLDAGYDVSLEEFIGQFEYASKEGWPENELENIERQQGVSVKLQVRPQPWGG